MAIGRDGIRVVSPANVERQISEWISGKLVEKRRTGSFGKLVIDITIKEGEPDFVLYSDNVTVKVEK